MLIGKLNKMVDYIRQILIMDLRFLNFNRSTIEANLITIGAFFRKHSRFNV